MQNNRKALAGRLLYTQALNSGRCITAVCACFPFAMAKWNYVAQSFSCDKKWDGLPGIRDGKEQSNQHIWVALFFSKTNWFNTLKIVLTLVIRIWLEIKSKLLDGPFFVLFFVFFANQSSPNMIGWCTPRAFGDIRGKGVEHDVHLASSLLFIFICFYFAISDLALIRKFEKNK